MDAGFLQVKKAHYELANQDAVFLLASGEKKTPHPRKASRALCKAHKMQHSDSVCLYSVAPALFFLTSHLAQISLRARERHRAALSEMKTATCQRLCQFRKRGTESLPTHWSLSMLP